MRPDWRPLLVAAVIAGGAGVLGLGWGDAFLIAVAVAVLGFVSVALDAEIGSEWPQRHEPPATGTRAEVAALTWSLFGRDGRVTEAAVRRLRKDATRRLARVGIVVPGGLGAATPTSSAVDEELRQQIKTALGERTWAVLTAPGGWMPSLREIAHCVQTLEALAPQRVTGGRS